MSPWKRSQPGLWPILTEQTVARLEQHDDYLSMKPCKLWLPYKDCRGAVTAVVKQFPQRSRRASSSDWGLVLPLPTPLTWPACRQWRPVSGRATGRELHWQSPTTGPWDTKRSLRENMYIVHCTREGENEPDN